MVMSPLPGLDTLASTSYRPHIRSPLPHPTEQV